MKHPFLLEDKSKTLRFNAGSRAGMCCNHLALILGCGVGVHGTAQESVVVKCCLVPGLDWRLCCWARVRWDHSRLLWGHLQHHIPATSSSPPVPRCLLGRETGVKFSVRTVKKLSVPSLLEDCVCFMAFYFLHSFCVIWAAFLQAPPLLQLGAGFLPSRDFVAKFIVLYLHTNLSGFSPSLFKQPFFFLFSFH